MHRFTTCLDSGKSGLRVNTHKFREDRRAWDRPLPDCMKKGGNHVENQTALKPVSDFFVLDALMRKGEEIRNRHLNRYEQNKERVFRSGELDPDLTAPIARAIEQIGSRNQAVRDELTKLEEHVERVRHAWRAYWGSKSSRQKMGWGKVQRLADRQANNRRIEELRIDFASNPGPDEIGILLALDPHLVSKLKASIAAGANGGLSHKFAFAMAYESLLTIKAEASGGVTPIARPFGDILGVNPAIGRFHTQ